MSRVFVAEETTLERKVVIKVLPPELAAAVNLERFKREIALAAKLQHPNIVPVLASGVTEGLPYYTMPFVEGESLRARIAREGELPINVDSSMAGVRATAAKAISLDSTLGVPHAALGAILRDQHRWGRRNASSSVR